MSISLGIGLGITQQRGAGRLGPELIVDGDFPTTDNWTTNIALTSNNIDTNVFKSMSVKEIL